MFWKKKESRQVKDKLKSIHKKISRLKLFSEKKDRAIEMAGFIIDNIDSAKEVLMEEATEQKSKPWIDAKYDSDIDAMLKAELKALDELKKKLEQYKTDFGDSTDIAEIEMLTEEIQDESKTLEARNAAIEKKIEDFERITLKARLKIFSIRCPALSTSDGINWANIATVARQLGGWLEPAGRHAAVIRFPNAKRAIPVSGDIHSGVISREFVAEITHLPPHKIPSSTKLQDAFNAGDIHRAA